MDMNAVTHKPYRNILMVYPEFPVTYWGMQRSLPLIGKKASMPPLGLLTIAAMTPDEFECRLVDLNCESLSEDDLAWADMVCFSAMITQRASLFAAAIRCRNAGKLVVFGGPFPTGCPDECALYCDVQVLNEGEATWPRFLDDVRRGTYRAVYTSDEKPDVTVTPIPRFDLINIEDYLLIPIQFSRGCPFSCEFCDIIVMFGRKPRTKTPEQICAELDALYRTGYRGTVFIVDDNFIGNKREVKRLLPRMKEWNEAHGTPFGYGTEATINLADDRALLQAMVDAGFDWVFVGIETPSEEALKETQKYQNTRRSLVASVHAIQNAGLLVYGGFIIGFDSDTEDIFDRQIEFITEAAIPYAMVGLLGALPGTPLYSRLREAGRLKDETFAGDNQCGYTNIVTTLPRQKLLEGYRRIIESIYTTGAFFTRSRDAISRLPVPASILGRIQVFRRLYKLNNIGNKALRRRLLLNYRVLKTVPAEFRWQSLWFLCSVFRRRPELLPGAISLVVLGLHFCQFSLEHVLPQLDKELAAG
jgi:radical SAM superfamily enzyme YgiQ (UPF0313 family)